MRSRGRTETYKMALGPRSVQGHSLMAHRPQCDLDVWLSRVYVLVDFFGINHIGDFRI